MIWGAWWKTREDQLHAAAQRKAAYAKEQAKRPQTKVEIFARAYCSALGYDPDSTWLPGPMMPSGKLWMKYRYVAEDALHNEAKAAGLASLLKATTTP